MLMMTFSFIILDPSPVMPGSDRASLLLQCLGRVGAGGTEGLPEDGGEGDREG